MTEDYKERIIKYLTNNYSKETESTEAFFVSDAEQVQLTESFSTYFDEILGYIQGKDGKGNDLNLGFVYGNQNNKGVIAIVDENFNIIQVINEYNTGTDFNEWICLNIDITNGNIYGLDMQGNQTRFLLLNNFLVKTPAQQNYEVKLRNDYFLTLNQTPEYISKCPSSALYVILGRANAKPFVSTYKIEVGATNVLTDYAYTGNVEPTTGIISPNVIKDYNIVWQEEDFNISMASYQGFNYLEFNLTNEDSEISLYKNIQITYSGAYELENVLDMCISNIGTYIGLSTDFRAFPAEIIILKLNYTNNTFETIYTYDRTHELIHHTQDVNFKKKDNHIFFNAYYNLNSPAVIGATVYGITFGIINSNGILYKNMSSDFSIYNWLGDILFNVVQNYNLVIYNFSNASDGLITSKQIFNDNNYNCIDYQDYNSMIPNSGILYDEDGNVIFARNLYNKTLNGNSTMSTLEIPNMLLNDITISQQDLLGQTNGTLISNETDIEKNIYEDVFINFNNTITIQDQNTQEYVSNLNGATRLNNSISNTADYTNATLNKIRINYADNTSFVKTISPASQVSQFVYKYTFNIYITKAIDNIELISNDTNTVYQTIDASELEVNKAYKISQNVEIQ